MATPRFVSMVPGLMEDRRAYFATVQAAVEEACRGQARLLVLLDPDTGLEPASGGDTKHVLPSEVASIYETLRVGDLLVPYQHRRRKMNWLAVVRRDLATALGLAVDDVAPFTCQTVASDVALMVVEKQNRDRR